MISKIASWLMEWCRRNGKLQNITGREDSDIYMVRAILFRSKWFSIYIHRFIRSDRDSYHDHPWNFFTYVVSGEYVEHRPGHQPLVRNTKQNRLKFRRATDFHYVKLNKEFTGCSRAEINKDAPLTICFIGPRKRAWGFISKTTGQWVYWKKYLGIPHDSEDMSPTTGQWKNNRGTQSETRSL